VLWATGITVLGYFLGSVQFIANNLEAIALLIVLVSVLPMIVEVLRARSKRRDERYDEPHERQAVLDDDVRG
jgi:membrane-associated protein